ncbi:NPC intracellular cholesterol transporter 2-like [Stegodyphus dumicola]|uniref:NPC intracellular cholesterol transporter 2-like n=1 Tax=Stegodyphus dumicola TaxID=202533 RepID=UPI0015A99BF2|nr:NPC intracellular cholesterol transporter 2-like [Stegodyphus dumicola]
MIVWIFLSAAVFSQALGLKYTDCGSKSGKILDVQLTGCEETDICELKRGETYTYQIQFESLTDSESAKTVVHGIVNGISMPFPVQNPNACENGNLDCPLETGKSYTYLNEVEVRKSYPSVRADVKYEIKDENKENLACVIFPVKVV